MKVIRQIKPLREFIHSQKKLQRTIGCVPTMGALHQGHLSLIQEARKQCDCVVATIFVNPTQFAPTEDLSQYPRPLENDLALCEKENVDFVFTPSVEDIYPSGKTTTVHVPFLGEMLEGEKRPGHFDGVTTIVLKLFQIVQPNIAYFGAKDFQQQLLIRKMCVDLNVPIEIQTCPTIREADGLAMSSRNIYLNSKERKQAISLSQTLKYAKEQIDSGITNLLALQTEMAKTLSQTEGVKLDYVVIADAHTLQIIEEPVQEMVALVAAHVGTTRLIDNLLISKR